MLPLYIRAIAPHPFYIVFRGYNTANAVAYQVNVPKNTGTIALTSDIPPIPTSLPASDVYDWAKASTKPSYSWSEITNAPARHSISSPTSEYIDYSRVQNTSPAYVATFNGNAATKGLAYTTISDLKKAIGLIGNDGYGTEHSIFHSYSDYTELDIGGTIYTFPSDTTDGWHIYSGDGDESGGLFISPDGCTLYNSGDNNNFTIFDEDEGADFTNLNKAVFRVTTTYSYARSGRSDKALSRILTVSDIPTKATYSYNSSTSTLTINTVSIT